MANRHQRRKRAQAKRERILEGLAQAERSRRIAKAVRDNKSRPIERNYYPTTSNVAMIGLSSVGKGGHVSNLFDKGQRDKARMTGCKDILGMSERYLRAIRDKP